MTEAPQKAILALGTEGYFNLLARPMGADAKPPAENAPILARMAEIGIAPGQPFEFAKLDSAVQEALKDVPETATKKMNEAWAGLGKDKNGWRVTTVGGRSGTNYLERGAWASNGWPSQLPKVSV